MIIQVLGTGCTKCKMLYETGQQGRRRDGRRGPGGEGRGHPADHDLQHPHDAGPGHRRLREGRRPGAEPGGGQEADRGGQGRLASDEVVSREILMDNKQRTSPGRSVQRDRQGHGLISREAVYQLTDKLMPGRSDTVCLALLVTGDTETREKVQTHSCITVDGCPKLCAKKNVELSGGKVALGVRVYDTLKRHRGQQFGSPTALSDAGWAATEEIAAEIAETAEQLVAFGKEA